MTDWKDNERTLATLVGGQRLPSNGMIQADVVAPKPPLPPVLTIESKRRTGAAFPGWLTAAFDQASAHRRIHHVDHGYVVVAHHNGRGHPARWYLMVEFFPKDNTLRADIDDITKHAEYIPSLLRAAQEMTPEEEGKQADV